MRRTHRAALLLLLLLPLLVAAPFAPVVAQEAVTSPVPVGTYVDPAGRFTIVAIVWGRGQFSPIHAHHTWCAYAVHENALEETLYDWDGESAAALPARTEVRSPGYGCYAHAGLDQIHRLGNSGSRPAISIHVYGVERERVGTHVNKVVKVG